METQNNTPFENNTTSSQSIEVEKIIEFYKDLDTDEEPEKVEVFEKETKFKKLISLLKKNNNNSEIQSEVYGLSEKSRIILYRIVSAVVSVLIVAGSFVLAYFLPANETTISEQQDKLRSDPEYADLKSRYDALKTEVENSEKSNIEKKSQINKISDSDNTKAELRTQITAKSYELNELNGQIEEKRKIISELDKSIAEKAPPETVLSPGKYIVGKNIAAGKYTITGTGKFMVASASGKSKINTTLSSTPINIVLETNDIVKFDSKVKFSFSN